MGLIVFLAAIAVLATHLRSGAKVTARPLALGTRLGAPAYPMGDRAAGGVGQMVDGLRCREGAKLGHEPLAHLTLIVFGKMRAVPPAIGVVLPHRSGSRVVSGACAYPLRTKDASGLIELARRGTTLGQFFDIWGEDLTRRDAAGVRGQVSVFLDGAPFGGDPRTIHLRPGAEITVEVGGPSVVPTVYRFATRG